MTLEQLFSTGHIADLVLAIMALETMVLLFAFRPWTAPRLAGLIGNIAAGACLVVALRIALTGGDWRLVAIALIGSLIGHAADVVQRVRASKDR